MPELSAELDLGPEVAQFRAELREWIAAEAPDGIDAVIDLKQLERVGHGTGSTGQQAVFGVLRANVACQRRTDALGQEVDILALACRIGQRLENEQQVAGHIGIRTLARCTCYTLRQAHRCICALAYKERLRGLPDV